MYDLKTISDQDLLALTFKESAAEVVSKFSSLKELAEAAPEELAQIKGLGIITSKQLISAIELGRRAYGAIKEKPKVIRSPQDVYDLLGPEMKYLDRENFKIILVNTKHHVLSVDLISIGSVDSAIVDPKLIFKTCLKKAASAVICCHNHPSTDPSPSSNDLSLTKRLVEAGKLLSISVLDHVVIGGEKYYSLKEHGHI